MLEPRFARLRRRGAAPSNTTRMVLLELAAYSERCEPHSAYSLNDLLSPLPMRRCDSRDKLLTWQLFDAIYATMNYNDIPVFARVVETGSLTKAARTEIFGQP